MGFGLGAMYWGSLDQGGDQGDVYTNQAFRFIGQEENDYQRWSAGDLINLFFVDWENS
jgi:hypothetical protein